MTIASSSLFARRRAGVLLHITSLPGNGARGHLGSQALQFAGWLAATGFSVWQMLPIGPTDSDLSPYQSCSAFAYDPSLAAAAYPIHQRAWNDDSDPATHDWEKAAHEFFVCSGSQDRLADYAEFRRQHLAWLDDYALFAAIRSSQDGKPWYEWPAPLRNRDPESLQQFSQRHATELQTFCYQQYVTDSQWRFFRERANALGINLFGDLPIFVAHDSADVWSHRNLFLLDANGALRAVSGVPPDYFSETGQRWGQPLYDWNAHAAQNYRWWIERIRIQAQRFDLLRLDHFRGFSACWAIPPSAHTASKGSWSPGPGAALFEALNGAFGHLPCVAENLGVITADVENLRQQFNIPGMSVLQFGFDGEPSNSNLPHNLAKHAVVYTGTHDNDTTVGWWQSLASVDRHRISEYLGWPMEGMPESLIRAALRSVSSLAMIPMQDLLQLDTRARMNLPGRSTDNWRWRFAWDQIPDTLGARSRQLLAQYGRLL